MFLSSTLCGEGLLPQGQRRGVQLAVLHDGDGLWTMKAVREERELDVGIWRRKRNEGEKR